jgi:cobalamin synthase
MQQGVESVLEVTLASSVTSDGSSNPSLRLLLLRELHAVARTATIVVIVFVRVSFSSRDALWWCKGHLWLRCRGRLPPRLHLLLRRGGRVLLLLLLLLASTLLLRVQTTMQPLQVARLACHRATQWALRKARGQKGDH